MDSSYQKFKHFQKNEEFQEEDVWSVLPKPKSGSTQKQKPISITSKGFPSAARMIRTVPSGQQWAQSAPVNIPDWSEMKVLDRSDEEEEEEDEDAMIPPHEWVAMKQGKNEMMSFSVCEGAGRTLKGRDLRKVRYAVLTRTGFLE